jgi:serine/threonine protein phosphatase PrpC
MIDDFDSRDPCSAIPDRRPFAVEAAGATHVGKVRTQNEDDFCVDQELGLLVVADGMGGHQAGEVASRGAVAFVQRAMRSSAANGERMSMAERLVTAIRFANAALFERSARDAALARMGTTIVAVGFADGCATVAHAGDSRAYRLRHGTLERLTRDHSAVEDAIASGVPVREARGSIPSNAITKAIGLEPDVEVDVAVVEARIGDRFLLCSDGLSGLVGGYRIEVELRARVSARAAAHRLVQVALDAGGTDNVTVIVADLELDRLRG